jgi:hypothetical protein
LTNVTAVAAGDYHTLALRNDGTVWNWGYNGYGQLGDSTTTQRSVPVQVSGMTGGLAVAGGTNHSISIKSDGTLQAWGDNSYGQLGNTSTADSTVPVAGTVVGFSPVPPIGSALKFVTVTSCRIADTRNATGAFGGPVITGGTTRSFFVPNSACGIPGNAAAYSINVTVVPRGPLGFLTVWPTGSPLPNASTLNSLDGRVKANAAIVPAGTSGGVSVYVTDTADVILDINGYFVASNVSTLSYYPLAPCRVADTRASAGTLGGPYMGTGQTRAFPVRSSTCNVPATAQAYSLNFTAIPHGGLGFISAWGTGGAQPLVSTLNAPTGQVTANAAIVPAGTTGQINVYASGDTDLVIDINGYFAPAGVGGLSLYTVTPCRVLDSRGGAAPPFTGAQNSNVAGSLCGIDPSAQAYVFGATVVPPGPLGFLSLWPQGQSQPLVSTLNALDGAITSNMAIVPTTNGWVSGFVSSASHLILDISGFFAP